MIGSFKKTNFIVAGLSYVGAFVGAGFISGQELVQFFIRFGVGGLIGWIATVVTISVGGGKILEALSRTRPESFEEIVEKFFGIKITKLITLIINGYLIGGLIIMLSGAGGVLAETANISPVFGVSIISLLIFLTIIGKAERLLRVNQYLVPMLILSTLITTTILFVKYASNFDLGQNFTIKNPSPMLLNPVFSYFFYIGYNALGAFVALVNIAKKIQPDVGRRGGIFGGIIISILGSLLFTALWLTYPEWQEAELPIIFILKRNFGLIYYLFLPSILIAMFTVATAYALGISKYFFKKLNLGFNQTCLGLMLTITPIALLGFSRLIGMIYPFFGIMATLILIYLIFKFLIKGGGKSAEYY